MASVSQWTPFGVALDITATVASVTRISATQYTVKFNVSWSTHWDGAETNYGMKATSGGGTATINKFGNYASKGSGTLTGTYSISGNGSASKSATVTFTNWEEDWDGDVTEQATKGIRLSFTVPAWTSYTVTYNANGGSGAPGKQTKWKDQTLTLSTTKPARTGYTFSEWNTEPDGSGTSYSPGGSYKTNAGDTLYAIWTPVKYTVTYNANGGTLGSVKSQTKTYGATLKLTGTATRTNYNFLGWSTNKSATTATYKNGSNFTTNANTTLYAVWELAYTVPRITGYSVNRCDSSGKTTNNGTYALVKFNWACDRTVSSVSIECISTAETITTNVTASGTSGAVSQVIGGELSTDKSYTIRIIVEDSGGSYSRSLPLNSNRYPFDALKGGKGIAFGKTAEDPDYADFAYSILMENGKDLYVRDADGSIKLIFEPNSANGNVTIGYGNYANQSGNVHVYGHDIVHYVSNIANPGYYRPYRRRGDSTTITFRTSGYVTNGGKDVSFWIPFSVPIMGSPTVTIASGSGFVLRQGDAYTHGSSASASVVPDSYEAVATMFNGIYVKAVFSNVNNVTNNDSIGIYWNGTITFS